jgi:anaerobic magnesium-protoporphyrin IX monomethyl ester cyclase
MRIALVGPELEENLSLRYIRAALERDGHETVQIEFNEAADLAEAAGALVESRATIAGLSMVFTVRARQFVALAERARTLGFGGHIVAGGHFAAFNAEALLRDVRAIDSVARGEGEGIVCDLARHLPDLAPVPGLVWRSPTGDVVANKAACSCSDLDALPWPTRRAPPDEFLGLPTVNLLQSRGCEHACAFCSIAAWHRLCGGARYRARAPAAVVHEMASLHAQGVRIFNFHDDNFLPRDPGRRQTLVLALERAWQEQGLGRVAFAIKARPDEVEEELFARLQRLGLFRVFLGVEAGTADSLLRLGRGQSLDDNERALDVVSRLGLHACFNLLLLNPDSTLEDLAANARFLRRRPHHPMNFCRTEIYAGTPLERKLRRQGRLLGDYFGYDYHIADPRAEIACEAIYALFRSRNWNLDGLHSQVMRLDYENTLLLHFWSAAIPARTQARLTDSVKEFIQQANLDSAGYLDRIIAMAGAGPSPAEQLRFVEETAARMRKAEARLLGKCAGLLARIHSLAEQAAEARRPRVQVARALAAGLAATVAVTAAGCEDCRRNPLHYHEMVAAPHEPEPAPPPPDAALLPDTAPAKADAEPAPAPKAKKPRRRPPHFNEYAPPRLAPPRPPERLPRDFNEMAPDWNRE